VYTIRAVTDADTQALVALRNMLKIRWGTLTTPFESVDRYRKFQANRPIAIATHLAACAGEEIIGTAGLFRTPHARCGHSAVIGIMVHDDWQGRGVGSALFAALTDLADNWLALRRLELGVFADNAPAIALYRKFGFAIEATERGDAFREGAFVDGYVMARLRGDLPRDLAPWPAPPEPAPPGPFTLRATEPEDADAIATIMNQPRVRHGTLRLPYCTADDVRLLTNTEQTNKSIVAVAGGTPVGIVTLTPAKARQAHTADLSILAVHDAYQGRGIGRALVTAVLDVADNWLNLRRIGLNVMADNQPAIALYRAVGFEPEGTKQANTFRNGAYADALVMGRLR
jgi:RimJ/RimL family protein N-acetyltransferase